MPPKKSKISSKRLADLNYWREKMLSFEKRATYDSDEKSKYIMCKNMINFYLDCVNKGDDSSEPPQENKHSIK
jgi:hypothetical protein